MKNTTYQQAVEAGIKEFEEKVIAEIRHTYTDKVWLPIPEDKKAKDAVAADLLRDMAPAMAGIASGFLCSFADTIAEAVRGDEREEILTIAEEAIKNALFNNDLRWTRIHEMIKMRAPISAEAAEYYEKPFMELRTKLTALREKI